MLTEEQIKAIVSEAEEKYPVARKYYGFGENEYHDINCRSRTAHIAALTQEREKVKPLLEALEEISIDRYPENVFTPMTDEEFSVFVRYVQRRYSVDQISGYYGRFFHKIHIDIAQEAINNFNKNLNLLP
jgi:hypothetical protein